MMPSALINKPVRRFSPFLQLQKLKTSYIYHTHSAGRGCLVSTSISRKTVGVMNLLCMQNEYSQASALHDNKTLTLLMICEKNFQEAEKWVAI
ncbi:hypothetical protein D8Y20_07880 [Mariprofundus sp. EBB-1]|nr:hypothetical protein D8Y20_07880 [Mariprofundus sp. EBB-1]